jgi:hypothetical protein
MTKSATRADRRAITRTNPMHKQARIPSLAYASGLCSDFYFFRNSNNSIVSVFTPAAIAGSST